MSVATAPAARGGATAAPAPAAIGARLVRFQVGGQPYALPLERVAEVIALGSATATAPRGWVGTLVRDQRPLPIGDLAFLLGVAPVAARRDRRAVILRGPAAGGALGSPLYGLTVESVPAVGDSGDGRLEPLPPIARRGGHAPVWASLIEGDDLLLLLDADALGERLAAGVVRTADGRISELRALPRRPGDTNRLAAPAGRAVARDASAGVPRLRRDTPTLLLGGVEMADGDEGIAPAVPMAWVQEVRALQPVRPVPHAPAGLAGVIAWRGRCLPVLDLTHRLTGIPSAEAAARRLLIVGPQGGAALGGLIVPAVRGLATIAAAAAAPPPPLPDTLDPALLAAWTRHGDEAVALLDPAACFA